VLPLLVRRATSQMPKAGPLCQYSREPGEMKTPARPSRFPVLGLAEAEVEVEVVRPSAAAEARPCLQQPAAVPSLPRVLSPRPLGSGPTSPSKSAGRAEQTAFSALHPRPLAALPVHPTGQRPQPVKSPEYERARNPALRNCKLHNHSALA